MICVKCKEKIPIISNLNFEEGTILLYCQCDNENEEYLIKDYLKKINDIKEDNIIKTQVCFVHKNNCIELFCIDCSKELCYECDIKSHQKENHQICKLDDFFIMIKKNIKYYKNIKDLFYCPSISQKYINDIIKFIENTYILFYEQEKQQNFNFTVLKNICYIELRLFEYNNNKNGGNNKTEELDKKGKKIVKENQNKVNYDKKIYNMRLYYNIKKVELKSLKKRYITSFFNILLIPNSYYCILISPENKLLVVNINNKEIEIEKKIKAKYELDPKINSSLYNFCLLNEEIFALIYISGSFDLFFIQKNGEDGKDEKISLIRKKYIYREKSTNIISQITLTEDNKLLVIMNDKIKIFEFNNNDENISLLKEIDRNRLTLFMYLNFHNCVLNLYNNKEIIIMDNLNHKNYKINDRKNINLIYEIKTMNYLAFSHFNEYIYIFDLNLMVMKTKLAGHKKIINDIKELIPLKNSTYKSKLISCSDDNTIRIWNLIKFNCDLIISLENQGILCKLNILPNKEIMTIANDNSIYIIE